MRERPATWFVLGVSALVLASSTHFAPMAVLAGETLYNGIVLANDWPPRFNGLDYDEFRNGQDLKYYGPMAVPYLEHPPQVISIDVGRQLFVDDFLIQNTNLKRTYHLGQYHPASPMIRPDKAWEDGNRGGRAMVNSDGVWYDPQDKLFKMWYRAYDTCYAVSTDGLHWEKPELDVVPGTNIVLESGRRRTSGTVWLDMDESDPARRYKMICGAPGGEPRVMRYNTHLEFYYSGDGVHWSPSQYSSPSIRDRSTVFYNPFRKMWVFSIKVRPCVEGSGEHRFLPLTRSRAYRETPTFFSEWTNEEIVPWVGADNLDLSRNDGIDVQTLGGQHLYNLDCVAYESLLLGLFTIYHGNGTGPNRHHHMNDLTLGYSRDGFHWYRPDRRAFLGVGDDPTQWNYNNIQSAGGCCLVVGDELRFYVSGRSKPEACNTGLATLRRDGFASMDAGAEERVLITRPVRFNGKHLFVNVDCPNGELRVDVLREDVMNFFEKADPVIEPFARDRCIPIRANSTLREIRWEGADDLSELAGSTVRFRFHLRQGSLYSFWVSPNKSGASGGYVAAGGPGFTCNRDKTVKP